MSTRALSSLALILAVSSFALDASAQRRPIDREGRFGVGLGIGSLPYGASWKYYMRDDQSIEGKIGPHLTDSTARDGVIMALDSAYLFEMPPLISANGIDLSWNVGAGMGFGVGRGGSFVFDASAVGGLVFLFHDLPMDFAVEYRPGLRFKDRQLYGTGTNLYFAYSRFGIHLRYYVR